MPSVFEVLACDRLKESLREAFRYLLEHLKASGISSTAIATDEIVLLLDLLIEYNYLRSYESSYTENLYGLIRSSTTTIRLGNTESKHKAILLSLVPLVFIPYVKHKIDKHFEDINFKETRTADELRKIRLYRIFSKSCSLLNLICLVQYAAGNSEYYKLSERLLKIHLENRSDVNTRLSTTTAAGENEVPVEQEKNLISIADKISRALADVFGSGLTIGSYIIQFLDHWNTHSNSSSILKASLPIPEPPRRDDLAYSDEKSSSICLICMHVRQNECVLSNTGYVFCYSCLQRYVKSKQRCPVTGHPTTLDNIVKLFTTIPS